MYFSTGSLTTRRCTFIVVRSIRRQPRPPPDWNADVGLDVREPTEDEHGQDVGAMGRIETQLFPSKAVNFQCSILVITPSKLETTSVCSV